MASRSERLSLLPDEDGEARGAYSIVKASDTSYVYNSDAEADPVPCA